MGDDRLKVVYEKTIGGVTRLFSGTTAAGDQGLRIKQLVPLGNPYWAWPAIPAGRVVAADFTGAPLCSDDIAVNNAAIGSITTLPEDVLTYE